MGEDWRPTRRELASWWVQDRVWQARHWLASRVDDVAFRLLHVADWLSGRLLNTPSPPPLVADLPPSPAEAAPPPVITPTAPLAPPIPYSPQWCDGIAAWRLVDMIVQAYDLPEQDVARCLAMVPASGTHLFDSAEGWSILADAVASHLGAHPRIAFLTPSLN